MQPGLLRSRLHTDADNTQLIRTRLLALGLGCVRFEPPLDAGGSSHDLRPPADLLEETLLTEWATGQISGLVAYTPLNRKAMTYFEPVSSRLAPIHPLHWIVRNQAWCRFLIQAPSPRL